MTLVFDRVPDTKTVTAQSPDDGEGSFSAAYHYLPKAISPSGRYIVCGDYFDAVSLSDTTAPPAKVWSHALTTGTWLGDILTSGELTLSDWLTTGFRIRAVDDEGTIWGEASVANFELLCVPADTQELELAFTWSDDNGIPEGAEVSQVFTFNMPDDSIFVLMFPQADSFANNPLYFTATKGVGSTLTRNTTGSWAPITAFQDDEGNVWIAGVDRVVAAAIDTLYMLRITDVGSSSYPDTLQTFTMPSVDTSGGTGVSTVALQGLFANGCFVGGWIYPATNDSTTPIAAQYLFKAALDGSETVTLRDVTADPVIVPGPGGSSFNGDDSSFKQQLLPNPTHFFVQKVSSLGSFPDNYHPYGRLFTELDLSTLAFGTEYNLNDWDAGDTGSNAYPLRETVQTSVYIDNRIAFAGTRYTLVPTDLVTPYDDDSDLFIYYFGPDGGGGGDTGATSLNAWGFRLDNHRYYVVPSIGLIYDLETGQWSEWLNEGLTRLRANVGQNWAGMTGTLTTFGSDVVAGDDTTGVIWIFDPATARDDLTTTGDEAFTRIVTSMVPANGRDAIPCNAVELTCALGEPSQTGASITLETSDDRGQTWVNHGSRTMVAGDFTQVIEWRGCGTIRAPGRIFRFSDDGATVSYIRAEMR